MEAKKIRNKILALGLFTIISVGNDAAAQTKVDLKSGTPVQMETSQELSSKNLQAQSIVDLRVRYDIKVNDKVVVQAGSIAKAVVVASKRAKACGKAGILEIKAVSATAVDGQPISLYASQINKEGDDKKGLAWGLSIGGCFVISPLSFFFLLIKGKEAILPAGLSIDGQVANTITVEVSQ